MNEEEGLRLAETLFLQSLSILEEVAPDRACEIMHAFVERHVET